jgi:hypothetical protein
MKTVISIFALTLALAFTVPAFGGETETRSNARRMALLGMRRPSTAQENIELAVADSPVIRETWRTGAFMQKVIASRAKHRRTRRFLGSFSELETCIAELPTQQERVCDSGFAGVSITVHVRRSAPCAY